MFQLEQAIRQFNAMYKMPVNDLPTLSPTDEPVTERLTKFKTILINEINEIDDIIAKAKAMSPLSNTGTANDVEVLTDLADLLGDIQVYCASEMLKFGLPLDKVLHLIMMSNFSKLMADGTAMFDENDKLQKGPNYWKPEPYIAQMLTEHFKEAQRNVPLPTVGPSASMSPIVMP